MGEAAKTPYHLQPEVQQKQRERYLALTPEQREERRIRQTEQQRIRRAKLKAGLPTGRKAAASPVDASKPVLATSTPSKPQERVQRRSVRSAEPTLKAQDLESYDDLSTHKAKAVQKAWRAEVPEYLLDCLTSPESPLTGAGMRASKMVFFWFGLGEKLNRIVEQEKPGQTEEFLLAVLLECLNRLTGNAPTGPAPTLPEIAQKSV